MTYEELTDAVTERLDQGRRGDHGWWLTTRVHLTAARLEGIAVYLFNSGAEHGRILTESDYSALARLLSIQGDNPGQSLRRHHLLALETPLRLLERTGGRSWNEVRLTPTGAALATVSDSAAVLEDALQEIVFCAEPFYTGTRVTEYSDFNVRPYPAILQVMENSDGYIDRDEYDLFVSRTRSDDEVEWAVDGIGAFRELSSDQRVALLQLVRDRLPSAKTYRNWRDMGLHAFSLFGVGQRAVRVDKRLVLTEDFSTVVPTVPVMKRVARVRDRTRARQALKIPEPHSTDELSVPPTAPETNSGSEAEILVAKLLVGQGWDVVFYSNRRGYGFDIWAKKGDAAIVVEVKSSLGTFGAITLTAREHEAALHYGQNFVIAVVENVSADDPRVWFVENPSGNVTIDASASTIYTISRAQWEPVARNANDA